MKIGDSLRVEAESSCHHQPQEALVKSLLVHLEHSPQEFVTAGSGSLRSTALICGSSEFQIFHGSKRFFILWSCPSVFTLFTVYALQYGMWGWIKERREIDILLEEIS